jgi:hypothetical protein
MPQPGHSFAPARLAFTNEHRNSHVNGIAVIHKKIAAGILLELV